MVIGFHMVWKTDLYLSFFGRIRFAEEHFGTEGGSRLFLKLIGVGACFVGILVATNLIQSTVAEILTPLFRSVA